MFCQSNMRKISKVYLKNSSNDSTWTSGMSTTFPVAARGPQNMARNTGLRAIRMNLCATTVSSSSSLFTLKMTSQEYLLSNIQRLHSCKESRNVPFGFRSIFSAKKKKVLFYQFVIIPEIRLLLKSWPYPLKL